MRVEVAAAVVSGPADALARVKQAAGDLAAAARLFDDVWYGERPADATTYARMVEVDGRVAVARPGRPGAAPAPTFSVPS